MTNESIKINLDFTPNPNTLKYSSNRQLVVGGTENYTSKKEADKYSPLASKLFDHKEI